MSIHHGGLCLAECTGGRIDSVMCRAHSFPRVTEFGRCRGIFVFPRNFTEFRINTEILRPQPNSVSLYCCCNCDTQSLRTATQACWFQWRVFTFSLLTYLSFYLPDLCRWWWPAWLARSTDEWWLIWSYHIIKYTTGPKSAQCTLKWAAAVSCGIPRICRRIWQTVPQNFVKICRGKLWALVKCTGVCVCAGVGLGSEPSPSYRQVMNRHLLFVRWLARWRDCGSELLELSLHCNYTVLSECIRVWVDHVNNISCLFTVEIRLLK